MPGYDGQVIINTKLDTKEFESGVRGLEGVTQKSIGRIKKIIGTAAIATLVTSGIKQVISGTSALDTAMAKTSTLFGDVDVNTSILNRSMLALSSASGLAADGIGSSLYNALSAGVEVTEDMAESTAYMEKNARLAKAGFADIDTTVTATAKVLNAYKLGVEETDRIHKVLMQTQNKGITTVGELGGVLAQVTPTAAAFGIKFEEVGTQIAILTKNGTPAAQAVTQINQMIAELGKSGTIASKNLMDASEAAGHGRKSFSELIDEGFNVGEILNMVKTYADENNLSMVDMFSSIDAGKGALAIASKGVKEYNSYLDDMSTESDVVTEAYNKMMNTFSAQADRLSVAIGNAGTVIGKRFLPTLTNTTKNLADAINRMSGVTTASSELKGAYENLSIAQGNYNQVLDNTQGKSDIVSESLREQARAARDLALADLTKKYADSQRALSKMNDSFDENRRIFEEGSRVVDELANKYHITRSELINLDAAGKNDLFGSNIEDARDLTIALMNMNGVREDYILGSASIKEAQVNEKAFIEAIAQAYLAEDESVQLLIDAYPELEEKIMSGVTAIKDRTTAQKDFEQVTWDSADALKEEIYYVESWGKYGKSAAYNAEYLALAKKKLAEMTKIEAKSSEAATNATDDETEATNRLTLAQWEAQNALIAADEARQRAFDNMGKDDPFEDMEDSLEKFSEDLKDEASSWENYFAQSARTMYDAFGSAFQSLGQELGMMGKKVKDLEGSISSAEDELKFANNDLLDAQEEYNEAVLSGDADAIDAAKDKLEKQKRIVSGIEETIASLEDEKDAVESGEEAFKAMGKTALLALADVLEGLGAELAARAVAAALGFNWGGAALAAAGAIAAYTASGVIQGYAGSYAEGGIVPQIAGVPSTGDKHIAGVNPGELILDFADQISIATQLTEYSRISEMLGSLQSGSGTVIQVNLSGSQIYGLNEEAVGRAIYRNIKTLQHEGVLKKW